MTAPIRDMAGLARAARAAQIERGLSDQLLEHLAGMASGSVPKYLAPDPPKNLGPVSLILLLNALGKGLVLVDDPETVAKMQHRWIPRQIVGGSAMQLQRLAAEQASRASIEAKQPETLQNKAKSALIERMKALSKLGASKGGKRRAKIMGKRARQGVASHAARKRWDKAEAK